ncbi:MAG: hypothetical protein ACXVC7_11225, partial [Bacteroidia bacterium]
TIPMRLEINFSKQNEVGNGNLKSTVFLLPRREPVRGAELTSQKLPIAHSMSLKDFLDRVTGVSVELDTIISSKGKCVMTFGLITDTKYAEPFGISLKASNKSTSTVTLGLSFNNNLIPCGLITFKNTKGQ